MKIWYDTEFHERGPGHPIEFISIGMFRECSGEYYAVTNDAGVMDRAFRDEWLRENVLPSLPVRIRTVTEQITFTKRATWEWDTAHPDFKHVKPRAMIAAEVKGFVLAHPKPQLWAWYADYDHVVLAQLFGRMIDLPKGFPMFTCDLKQEAERLGNPDLPSLPGVVEHNALSDAREVAFRHEWLIKHYGVDDSA